MGADIRKLTALLNLLLDSAENFRFDSNALQAEAKLWEGLVSLSQYIAQEINHIFKQMEEKALADKEEREERAFTEIDAYFKTMIGISSKN